MKILASGMEFKTFEQNQRILNYGDTAQYFFIPLCGNMTQYLRNNAIEKWDWALTIYNSLKEWKAKEFDRKVMHVMRQQLH